MQPVFVVTIHDMIGLGILALILIVGCIYGLIKLYELGTGKGE